MSDDNKADTRRLEHDIRETQDQIGDTVSKLEEQLSPKKIVESLFSGDGGQSNEWIAMAKRNPMATAMIGGGIVWLMSSKGSGDAGQGAGAHHDPHHRSYLDHISSVTQREGEDSADYGRRRDNARADYLMLERGVDEDDHGFRQRLDDATSVLRERTSAFGTKARDAASDAGQSLRSTGSGIADTGDKALGLLQDTYKSNPLVGGLLTAALGAAIGAALPVTQAENKKLGGLGEQARGKLAEGESAVADKAKNQMVEMTS